jgi:hypothetical protein
MEMNGATSVWHVVPSQHLATSFFEKRKKTELEEGKWQSS